MPKIILSYRRSDLDAIAGRIRDKLVSHYGDDFVFMDIDSIPFGLDFREHVKTALLENDILIAVIGPSWIGPNTSGRTRINEETDPVRIEVGTALQRNIPVVPVLVGGAGMPSPAELPDGLKDSAFRNCAVCHGLPRKAKTAIARGEFPIPPELFHGKGVTDDSPGETFWKVANGIRLTGMPSFNQSLSETQMWQISLMLANAGKLPSSVTAVLAGQPEAPKAISAAAAVHPTATR